VTLTDSLGNTYVDAVSQVQNSDASQVHILYASNIKGGANTVTATITLPNDHPWLAVYEYSGLIANNPLDKTASAQGTSANAATGSSATTSNPYELIFVGAGIPSGFAGSASAGSGYTVAQQDTGGSPAINETLVTNSAGSFNGTFNFSGSTDWSAVLATFVGSGTAGPMCDVNGNGTTNVQDVQLEVNMALGMTACTADINSDGKCNVVDVQRVTNAALGGQCVTQ
jgi:hypothetical protein